MDDSTPSNTPIQETVDGEELIRSEAFMNDVMSNMAKRKIDPAPTKLETSNRLEAITVQKPAEKPTETIPAETSPDPKPNVDPTPELEKVEATPEIVATSTDIEKRLKDAQAFIGKQSNVIGELKKKVAEIEKNIGEVKIAETEVEPYYEKLVKASEDDIAQLLLREAQKNGEQLDAFTAKQQARLLRTTAKMQLDIVKDAIKPVQRIAEDHQRATLINQKDAEWKTAHPGYQAMQPIMNQFIESAYPGGLEVRDELGQVIEMKANPYEVAHMAYEYAKRVSATAQATVENQNNQRIAAGRSLNAGTMGSVPSQTLQTKPKMDAKTAEIDRVFSQIEPALKH
jgi:hypothetical protein